jgi:hypothetical protein
MALTGKTIGQLDHLTSSLTGNEAFPIQYNGATYHISQSQIVANLATTGSNSFNGNQNITGSLIQGGIANVATGLYSHAEGNYAQAIGLYSHAEGYATYTGLPSAFSASISNTTVTFHSSYGNKSLEFTNGNVLVINEVGFPGYDFSTITSSSFNGINTIVEIEGVYNLPNVYVGNRNENVWLWDGDQKIPGDYAHSEGFQTYSPGAYSKSSGHLTTAYGYASHAEGYTTRAIGSYSHAEGSITKAIGDYSHAEGDNTQAKGNYSHAEGLETIASGSYSHAEGYRTIASANYQHVQGQWNATSLVESAFIVGNGTDDNNRSNLIHAAGNEVQISGSFSLASYGSTPPVDPPSKVGLFYFTDTDLYISLQ